MNKTGAPGDTQLPPDTISHPSIKIRYMQRLSRLIDVPHHDKMKNKDAPVKV